MLGGSMLIPLVLRWYWWRFNGWGFAAPGCFQLFAVACTQKFIQSKIGWAGLPFLLFDDYNIVCRFNSGYTRNSGHRQKYIAKIL